MSNICQQTTTNKTGFSTTVTQNWTGKKPKNAQTTNFVGHFGKYLRALVFFLLIFRFMHAVAIEPCTLMPATNPYYYFKLKL